MGHDRCLPLGGNVELQNVVLVCVCVSVCVRARARVIGTDSRREGGNSASDMVQNRVSVRVFFLFGESEYDITM